MDKRKIENIREKKNITQVLLVLMEEKSISEISISEIVARAGVARASFYCNYATKENVITTLMADILEEYRTAIILEDDDFYTYQNVHTSFVFSADMKSSCWICSGLAIAP